MSLGYARDSMADLQSLAKSKDNEMEVDTSTAPSANYSFDANIADDDFDNGFIIDDENQSDVIVDLPEDIKEETKMPISVSYDSSSSGKYGRSETSSRSRRQASSTKTKQPSFYTGFSYDDYYQDSYTDELMTRKKKNDNILCCIFPFLQDPILSDDESSEGDDASSTRSKISDESSVPAASLPESTATEVSSIAKETEAFLPAESENIPKENETTESQTQDEAATDSKDEAVTDSPSEPLPDEPKPLKGILKRSIVKPPVLSDREKRLSMMPKKGGNTASVTRRSILPSYEAVHPQVSFDQTDDASSSHIHSYSSATSVSSSASHPKKPKKKVSFSSMARVMPVLHRNEMSYYLKSMIWWQRNDYDDFKKTGRIISKAMLQGGSEIWLQTSNAWSKKIGQRKQSINEDGEEKKVIEDEVNSDDDVGNKWWCKFGHSRRGLEHIVSIDEGRHRQKLVNHSITAVLEEQRRQRLSRHDANKIANISMQYTSWARDLARAAGDADEEAVKTNFDQKAKCRLTHLSQNLKNTTSKKDSPCVSFVLAANSARMAGLLDSHTHSRNQNGAAKPMDNVAVTDIAHKAAGFQFQKTAA
ncbi:hypothetical protein CTEN210_04919 [Chaetoceros tenuissimus]|uniref:Uncharacterized protein n=1 Tax=Chaetoceros tenuissimus TaxID=426638 RepID=A0AAD3CM43_9STRA|nr:hypothetical protein CTEN210_04919 [Chaetoceros tenuissimus]